MARQSRSHVKSILIIFFDCEGVVHYEFAPTDQTINKEYYVEVLKRLCDAVRRKRPCFWSSGDWLLHYDNEPADSSSLVQQFLAKHKIIQLCQPPYQCSQNVDVNGSDHRCFELIVSSSFNQPMAVERGRSHELVGSMVGAVYIHVLRTLLRTVLT